jgi:alpha-tubulin suppressor-like RCC1 family protein
MELCLIRLMMFLTFIINVSCNKQEVVELSKAQEELNSNSSQILFILEPNVSISSESLITIRTMNIEKNDLIRIYSDSSCSTFVTEKTASKSILDIEISVTSNLKQFYYYKIYDELLNSSFCYSTGISYTLDATAPIAPSAVTQTASSGNTSKPTLNFAGIEVGNTIEIFTDSTCTYPRKEYQSFLTSPSISIDIALEVEGSYHFYYKLRDQANNYYKSDGESCIDSSLTYIYDITKPSSKPNIILSGSNPVDTDQTITLSFTSLSDVKTINIYTNSFCSGEVFKSDNTVSGSTHNINLTALGSNITNTFYYQLIDAAGNYFIETENGINKSCFTTGISYLNDQSPPSQITITNLTTKNSSTNELLIIASYPKSGELDKLNLTLSNLEINSGITVYSNTSCSGSILHSSVNTASAKELELTVPIGSIYQVSVLEANTSGETKCHNLRSYPAEGELNTLNLALTNLEINSTIIVYPNSACSGTAIHTETNTTNTKMLDLKLETGGLHQISIKQTDSVGNISTCSNEIIYDFIKIENVALGKNHSCVALSTGKSFCWGDNTKGQLGINSDSTSQNSPKIVSGSFATTKLSAKNDNTCFTDTSDEKVWCSGDNGYNQLTNSTTADVKDPIAHSGFIDVGIGKDHLCLIDSTDNYTYCVGKNDKGQLGNDDADFDNTTTPVQISEGIVATSLSIGFENSCFVDTTNKYNCFGLNTDYQLGVQGDNTSTNAALPTGVGSNISNLVSGSNFSCYIDSVTKLVHCFGSNANKRSGSQTHLSSVGVTQIDSDKQFNNISIGSDKSCGTTVDNELYCFGGSFNGVEKIESLESFTNVKVGSNHICATTLTGELLCMGSNGHGQLGNNSTTSSAIFVKVDFDFNKAQLEITPSVTFSSTSPKYYDFTTNTYGDFAYPVTISNTGNVSATVSSFTLSNTEFKFKGGSYPGTDGDCPNDKIILPKSTCVLEILFSPTLANTNGVSTTLDIIYSDLKNTYTQSKTFTGYTFKVLQDLKFEVDSTEFYGVYEFNSSTSPIDVVTLATITKTFSIINNSSVDIPIASIAISGTDTDHFKFSGGSSPGTNGTCFTKITANSSCVVSIDYKPIFKTASSHNVDISILLSLNDQITLTKLPLRGYASLESPQLNGYDQSQLLTSAYSFNTIQTILTVSNSETVTKVFEIKNDGLKGATITSTSFSGDNSYQYDFSGLGFPGTNGTCNLNTDIAKESSCLIEVIYTPTSASVAAGHEASLNINYVNSEFITDTLMSTIAINGHAQD